MIILGKFEESEKQFEHLLKNPFPDMYEYTLLYSRIEDEDTMELTFEWLQLKDMDAVKEMGAVLLKSTVWNTSNDIKQYRFLKYEETKIKR